MYVVEIVYLRKGIINMTGDSIVFDTAEREFNIRKEAIDYVRQTRLEGYSEKGHPDKRYFLIMSIEIKVIGKIAY